MALFELEWMGDTAERLFQKHRGERLEQIDWQAVRTDDLTDADLDRLRTVWTQSAHQEWCAGGAFTAMLRHLILARAPVDLIGMAGRFVADEMVHVELASRMANVYGGGVPLEVDPLAVEPPVSPDVNELVAVCELAVRVSCVGESFSLPLIAQELAGASDAVTRAVLQRIVADEAPHAMVGWLVLDWALPRLGSSDIEHLEHIAEDAIDALVPALRDVGRDRGFYDHVLQSRVATPLRKRGLNIRDTIAAKSTRGP